MADSSVAPSDGASAERGTQYPGDNLGEAIRLLESVRDAVGFGVATRELIASAMGYSSLSGKANRRLGTLSHFGLLTKSGVGAAKISDLGKAILMPRSEGERSEALVEAVKSPKLYAALIAKYAGHALPGLLANLLTREHSVNANSAAKAAAVFRESVEFAGLLRNGVLFESAESEIPSQPPLAPKGVSSREDSFAPRSESVGARRSAESGVLSDSNQGEFTIPLDARGRVAAIRMPLPLSAQDVRRIIAWAKFMEDSVAEMTEPVVSAN